MCISPLDNNRLVMVRPVSECLLLAVLKCNIHLGTPGAGQLEGARSVSGR